MKEFFYPESVVVVGVSPSPTNLARAIVYHLKEFNYTGRVHLVGPKGGSFMGHKIYKSILEIPNQVDLAAVLPARRRNLPQAESVLSLSGRHHHGARRCRTGRS